MSQIHSISLSKIQTAGLQVRAETDRGHVDDLAELFGDEGVWPESLPPCVVFHDGADYFLADGHHRYQAAQEAGCAEIPCEVRQGDRTAALWCAIGANGAHGLKRSNEDKRRAVLLAYQLDNTLSDREIARRARVSPDMVNYTLRPLRAKNPLSDSDSAATPIDYPSPADNTVNHAGAAPSPEAATPTSAAAPAPDVRTDARGRKMDVSRIGKSRPATPAPATAAAPRGLDEMGEPIPSAASQKAFAALDLFSQAETLCKQLAKLIDTIGKSSGGELLRAHYLKLKCETRDGKLIEHLRAVDLENLRRELKHWRPHAATCPRCGDTPKQLCKVCCGLPYVIEAHFERSGKGLAVAMRAEPSTAAAG